jgi:hypothetical protein
METLMSLNPKSLATIMAAGAMAVMPAAAVAKHGADDAGGDDKGGGPNRVVKTDRNRCSANSTIKLKAKHDDGRIETEVEVDQNRNGVRWSVRLSRNGRVAVQTKATTRAPSGSFSVERRITDGAGADRITARATSPSGEVCTASVAI